MNSVEIMTAKEARELLNNMKDINKTYMHYIWIGNYFLPYIVSNNM